MTTNLLCWQDVNVSFLLFSWELMKIGGALTADGDNEGRRRTVSSSLQGKQIESMFNSSTAAREPIMAFVIFFNLNTDMVEYRESIFVIMACTKQPSVFKFSFLVTFSGTQEEIYFVPPHGNSLRTLLVLRATAWGKRLKKIDKR